MRAGRPSGKRGDGGVIGTVFRSLLLAYGPQCWWPAKTPYEVVVGALLTQNTAWINVEKAISSLKSAVPLRPRAVLALPPRSLSRAIRPCGYHRQKARRLKILSRWFIDRFGGKVPAGGKVPTEPLRQELLALEGVGPETADSILLYAFGCPVFVVDAYTRRILHRLGLAREKAGYQELQDLFHLSLPARASLFNEYHALLVRHAKERCRKRDPACGGCPLARICGWEEMGPGT